jgi:hypothetical protein
MIRLFLVYVAFSVSVPLFHLELIELALHSALGSGSRVAMEYTLASRTVEQRDRPMKCSFRCFGIFGLHRRLEAPLRRPNGALGGPIVEPSFFILSLPLCS